MKLFAIIGGMVLLLATTYYFEIFREGWFWVWIVLPLISLNTIATVLTITKGKQ